MPLALAPPPIGMPPIDVESSKHEESTDSFPQHVIASINRTNSVEPTQNKEQNSRSRPQGGESTLKVSVISGSAMVGWGCVWDDRGGGK
eukprot:scaffold15286_cov105-Skeletonema_dohrnii-CCMP3373.AAC.1